MERMENTDNKVLYKQVLENYKPNKKLYTLRTQQFASMIDT